MRPTMTVLLVGTLLASVAPASTNEQWIEARFQAKMGRPTPGAELRQKQLVQARQRGADLCVSGCCRAAHHNAVASAKPDPARELLSAKLGRTQSAAAIQCPRSEAANQRTAGYVNSPWLVKWGRTAGPGATAAVTETTPVLSASRGCTNLACCD
jgi:hypothetical protein